MTLDTGRWTTPIPNSKLHILISLTHSEVIEAIGERMSETIEGNGREDLDHANCSYFFGRIEAESEARGRSVERTTVDVRLP